MIFTHNHIWDIVLSGFLTVFFTYVAYRIFIGYSISLVKIGLAILFLIGAWFWFAVIVNTIWNILYTLHSARY